jgi:hypothetical protein
MIRRAVEIVNSYDTPVTLRQLFYRLVVEGLIVNKDACYVMLSMITAEARRESNFPDLADNGRTIHSYESWSSPADALRDATACYRRNRTDGQGIALYLAVEKATLVAQMQSWFGDLGIPILALRGYSSESYERQIAEHINASTNGRPVVVLYAGDFDATGEDIMRNFKVQLTRRGIMSWTLEQVALTDEQVAEYKLPEYAGKPGDPRAKGFAERHGRLAQVEVEALAPEQLRDLYQRALDRHWNQHAHEAVLDVEQSERQEMARFINASTNERRCAVRGCRNPRPH